MTHLIYMEMDPEYNKIRSYIDSNYISFVNIFMNLKLHIYISTYIICSRGYVFLLALRAVTTTFCY